MCLFALTYSIYSGKIDMIVAGMTATDERRQQVEFSENYYNAAQVIIVNE